MGQEYRRTNEEKKREEFRAWLEEQIRRQVKTEFWKRSCVRRWQSARGIAYERTESRRERLLFRGLNTRW